MIQHTIESEDETRKRNPLLRALNLLAQEWAPCKLFTFGSFRLGVHSPGTDMDVLLVASSVTRDQFFSTFLALLKKDSNTQSVLPVPGAFVPLMKLQFCGYDLDLVFAAIREDAATANLFDQNVLYGLDIKTVYSLNGTA